MGEFFGAVKDMIYYSTIGPKDPFDPSDPDAVVKPGVGGVFSPMATSMGVNLTWGHSQVRQITMGHYLKTMKSLLNKAYMAESLATLRDLRTCIFATCLYLTDQQIHERDRILDALSTIPELIKKL